MSEAPLGRCGRWPVYADGRGLYAFMYDHKVVVVECAICGDYEFADDATELHDSNICGNCADAIMNLKHHKHSGRYLTWPNEQPKVYAKRKISHAMRRRVFERDKYRCVQCGTHLDLCIDHITPESKGGAHDLANFQTLCRPCNSAKGAKIPDS